MIIEIESNIRTVSFPHKYILWYKDNNEMFFNKIYLTYEELKIFLETYGYETNNLYLIQKIWY